MIQVKTVEYYGIAIRTLMLLTGIIAIFCSSTKVEIAKLKLELRNNIFIFYGLILILFYIMIYGINRADLTSYAVRITPIYEYSTLVFLFAYYFSGRSVIRKTLLTVLLALFVLQDFYYGGRITSLQLIFLALCTIFLQKLSFKFILAYGFLGILLNSLIGAYRKNYALDSVNVFGIIGKLKNGYFVFDTPIYAYYASATHIAASSITNNDVKVNSFFSFVGSIFTGSNNELSNLTKYVSKNYFYNIGGGVLPSHFYYWMGFVGVAAIALLVVSVFNKIGSLRNDFQKICGIAFISTIPRWYLYTPLSMFRPIFFTIILYFIFLIVHNISVGSAKRAKISSDSIDRKALNSIYQNLH